LSYTRAPPINYHAIGQVSTSMRRNWPGDGPASRERPPGLTRADSSPILIFH